MRFPPRPPIRPVTKRLLGFGAFAFWLNVPLVVLAFAGYFEGHAAERQIAVGWSLFVLLSGIVTLVIAHLDLRKRDLTPERRRHWKLAMRWANAIALPVWWWTFIRPLATTEEAYGALRDDADLPPPDYPPHPGSAPAKTPGHPDARAEVRHADQFQVTRSPWSS